MSDRMEQGSWRNLAGGVLTLCLTLTGCGGGAEPPDNYGIGSDALPALTKLVALGSEMTCSVQENTQAGGDQDTDEAQGQPTYEYSGLESGNQVAAEYVQMLEDNYDCSILGSRDAPKEEPDFQAERGEVTVGTKCAEGDGIFALEIRWQTQSCSITPVLLEGAEEEAESLTVEEAVHFLEEMPPERLGLSGSDMSSYLLFPEEGIVMVDGMPCYCINAYGREDHQILDTYLVSEDGSGLYRLDRGEDGVSALT